MMNDEARPPLHSSFIIPLDSPPTPSVILDWSKQGLDAIAVGRPESAPPNFSLPCQSRTKVFPPRPQHLERETAAVRARATRGACCSRPTTRASPPTRPRSKRRASPWRGGRGGRKGALPLEPPR